MPPPRNADTKLAFHEIPSPYKYSSEFILQILQLLSLPVPLFTFCIIQGLNDLPPTEVVLWTEYKISDM